MEKSEANPILSKIEQLHKTPEQSAKLRENTPSEVQNRCTFDHVTKLDLVNEIRPDSTVVVRVIGNDEVSGSIPLPGTTNQRGDLAEIMVTAKLARLGASVWTPAFGHDHPFDLIAHFGGYLSRIQVKAARDGDGGSILINGARVVDRAGGKQYPAITVADCDVIVGYHIESDTAYVMRPVGKQRYQLRRTPPKNNQIIGIMYERDFRLTTLEQLRPR